MWCGACFFVFFFGFVMLHFKKNCIGREERESNGPRESKNLKAFDVVSIC
jgi:hypothetical protein